MYASNLLGKKVYTHNGIFIGVVSDLKVNLEKRRVNGIVVDVKNKSGKKQATKYLVIPYKWLRCGDIIIVDYTKQNSTEK